MTVNARVYMTALVSLGIAALAWALSTWQFENPARFGFFALVPVGLAVCRVALPSIAGHSSFTPALALFGLLEFRVPEVLLAGCMAAAIETIWAPRRSATLFEAYFQIANVAVGIVLASAALSLGIGAAAPDYLQAALAAAVLFTCTTFPDAAIHSLDQGQNVMKVWVHRQIPRAPAYAGYAGLSWLLHGVSNAAGWPAALMSVPLVYLGWRMYELYFERLAAERRHTEQMTSLHLRTIETLALAVEAKDTTTSDHLRRVQVYAMELGRELGMQGDDLEALRAAAILHDIGKLAVPEYIVSKPGRLTPEEFDRMKIHPTVGAEIVEHVQFPYPVAPMVRAHHERWDGTGYPQGLRGSDIPLGARILAAVDTLDALASDRQYRRALPLDEAMAKVASESGKTFDPAVVTVLQRRYRDLERMAQAAEPMKMKLSLDRKVESSQAPGAGFEVAATADLGDLMAQISEARNDLWSLASLGVAEHSMSLDEFCAVFGVRLKARVPFDAVVIWLADGGCLKPAYAHGYDHRMFASLNIPVGQGLSGWVVENRKPILNGNPAVEPGYLNNPGVFSTMSSALAVPLEVSTGVIGALSLYLDRRDAFTREHLRIVQALAPRLATALETMRTRTVSGHGPAALDSLSLLRRLDDELARARRLNLPVGVIVCALNGMESLPKAEADLALRTVLGAMTEGQDGDAVARLSESEFAIVVSGGTRAAITARTERLARTPLPTAGLQLAAACAMCPEDGAGSEELLAAAERKVLGPAAKAHFTHDDVAALASGWVQ